MLLHDDHGMPFVKTASVVGRSYVLVPRLTDVTAKACARILWTAMVSKILAPLDCTEIAEAGSAGRSRPRSAPAPQCTC